MFRRLFLAYLALLVATLAVGGLFAARFVRGRALEEISVRLRAEVEVLRPLVRRDSSPPALHPVLAELGRRGESRLTVIAGDGSVLADSHAAPASMDNHNARPEVKQARVQGIGQDVRTSETVHYDMMYLAMLLDRDRPEGVVIRSALPITQVNEQTRILYGGIAAAFVLIAAAGAVVTGLLARWFTRPMREIRDVARAVAQGDFSRRAPLLGGDEIGSIAQAINRMTEELSARLDRLTEARSKLEALISSMEEGVVAVGRDGVVLHLNGAARRLFALDHDPEGLQVWEAIRVPGFEDAVRKSLREESPHRSTFHRENRFVEVSLCPVGGQRGAVLVAHDVTEARRYDDLRREFVANVSHELRTPLTLIQGYVETLREGALRDEARAPEFLETIDRNVRRLAAIVEDLLQLSRLESGGDILNRRETAVRPLLEKVLEDFRPLAAKKRQRFSLEGEGAVGVLNADPELVERALRNLADNALKYTPEEGSVTLSAAKEGDSVLFRVRDTGVGIPEADLPRIFERFYRVDKSRSRDLGGTGLGLAIVKHIAQLHGGSVSVESAPGAGSLFTLKLPATSSGRQTS